MIDVINLRKSFGNVEVLKGIDIRFNKGDIVAVIGASGSGKSTFLRCLNCMEDPTGGSIIFRGVDIADMRVDINEHRQHMGMVFQQFNLFNNLTVLDNITLAPRIIAKKKRRKMPNSKDSRILMKKFMRKLQLKRKHIRIHLKIFDIIEEDTQHG